MLAKNTWYTIELRHLSQGSSGLEMYLNNVSLSFSTDQFSGINFNVLNGPLYIGGHPQPKRIEVSCCTI